MLMSCDRRIWAERFLKTNAVTVLLHDPIRAKHTPAHTETEAKIHTPRSESKKLLNAQNGLSGSMGIIIVLIVKTVFALLGQ